MIDRQAWLEARRKGIGGTDAAAILGLSRYRTAIDVWEDKLGLAPERPATAAMEWGLRLEDAIARAYVVETGRPIRKVPMRRARHVSTFPMLGSIDRLGERVVEIKTARSDELLGDPEGPPEGRVPPDWYVQGQHYAEIVDRDLVDYAVLVGGSDFRIVTVPRDRAFGADLVAELGAWWSRYIVGKEQPEVSADDLDFLARKYPRDLVDELVATAELATAVDLWLDADQAKKDAEKERDGYRALIEDRMGTAGRLLTGSASVSWRAHERTEVAWREIAGGLRSAIERFLANPSRARKEDLREILSEGFGTTSLDDVEALFTTTKTVRPFLVTRKKEV